MPTFKLQEQAYHLAGSLLVSDPNDHNSSKFILSWTVKQKLQLDGTLLNKLFMWYKANNSFKIM